MVPGLIVETGSPDALCPALSSAEEAISARLGGLEVNGNWRVRYTIAHAPDAPKQDFVHLELYDQEDRIRLARDLPLAGETCATMAQVIALVVDRFFRPLRDDSGPVAAIEAAPAPRDRGPAQTAPGPTPQQPRARPFVLSLEGGILGEPVRPTAGLELAGPLSRNFSLAVGLTWVVLPARELLPLGGEAELRALLLRLDPSWDLALGGVRWGIGPTLAFEVEHGSATTPVASEGKFRVIGAAGAALSLKFPFTLGLFVGLGGGIELPFRPFGGRFVIDDAEVLAVPGRRAFLEAGIGTALFR